MIPTLGYPSHTAAILALEAQGKTATEIAAALGITVRKVSAQRRRARSASATFQNSIGGGTKIRALRIPVDTLTLLTPAAETRHITVGELCRRALAILAAEPTLLDNILDES